MENPWIKLPDSKPFIIESDKEFIEQFQLTAPSEYNLKTHLLPIPFIGSPSAPVLLLNLNPGFHKEDEEYQITDKFQAVARNCLTHNPNSYPFYFLDDTLECPAGGPGYNWWARRTLSRLLKEFNTNLLSQNIFCVEYFPYRSVRFCHLGTVLNSQHYGFNLVRQAIQREAQIVLMRAKKHWFEAVPDLETYQNLMIIKNPRNPTISERNLPDGGFQKIIRAIESRAQ